LIVGLGFGVEGLALGTSLGTWVNVGVLGFIAWRRGYLALEGRLVTMVPLLVAAALYALAVALYVGEPLRAALAGVTFLQGQVYFVVLGLVLLGSYGIALLGLGWRPR